MSASQPSQSSSSTLWAKASKEWVIPPKPRPGRKAQKEMMGQIAEANLGKRVKNRIAQRALRERKQSQIAELQARIQSYERGELCRNVALQSIAKNLKEQNEKLLRENHLLWEKLSNLEGMQSGTPGLKPGIDISSSITSFSAPPARAKVTSKSGCDDSLTPAPASSLLQSRSFIVPSLSTDNIHDEVVLPMDISAQRRDDVLLDRRSSLDDNFGPSSNIDVDGPISLQPALSCASCIGDFRCVCRDIALRQVSAILMGSTEDELLEKENLDKQAGASCTEQVRPTPEPIGSILDNLPPYQPPILIRWQNSAIPKTKSIFPVSPLPTPPALIASSMNCSGDPSNCTACADDAFGQAFCQAVENSAENMQLCSDCPCRMDGELVASSELASTSKFGTNPAEGDGPFYPGQSGLESTSSNQVETIPTNEAWRQIKSHPNVEFSDLALLADVVVRRSQCTGPRQQQQQQTTVLPPSVAVHQYEEPTAIQSHHDNDPKIVDGDLPRLVPRKLLIECGKRPVREVRTDALKAALRVLDAKFGHT